MLRSGAHTLWDSHLAHGAPGDPLRIPAGAFNAFIDAARDYQNRMRGLAQKAMPSFRQAGTVLVRNDSGADRGRFDVLGVSGPIFTPAHSEKAFKNQVALTGLTPSGASHSGSFVVLLEPVATGRIGLACASGVCPVKVTVEDESHRFADVNDGQAGSLKSGLLGAALILWRESGTAEKWAMVRLGVPVIGTHANPKVLGGSRETADTETWDIDNQPTGYDGVEFKPFRPHWSGTSGDPVYQFVRTATYDSTGKLVHVSAEVRSVAFATGPREV